MPKLQTLKSRLQAAPNRLSHISHTVGTDRIRGSALQKIRDRILARDCGICRCDQCLQSEHAAMAHEVEHRIPLWAGGAEDDSNRYAINRDCHKAKTGCEARMRTAGGYDPELCTCGRHLPADDVQSRVGA